jgi:hypothetical protein
MIAGVADTHTVLWYLLKDERLSVRALDFMNKVAAAGNDIAVSAISLAEIVYLIEKPPRVVEGTQSSGSPVRSPKGRSRPSEGASSGSGSTIRRAMKLAALPTAIKTGAVGTGRLTYSPVPPHVRISFPSWALL